MCTCVYALKGIEMMTKQMTSMSNVRTIHRGLVTNLIIPRHLSDPTTLSRACLLTVIVCVCVCDVACAVLREAVSRDLFAK